MMNSRSLKIPWGKKDRRLRLVPAAEPALEQGPSRKPVCMLTYCIFKVTLLSQGGRTLRQRPRVKIQIAGRKSLYGFARFIVESFGFLFDHCFAFYDNFERPELSKRAYELFVDIGEMPVAPNAVGVKKTRIDRALRKPGDRMLFKFDYGQDWRFAVELLEITRAKEWDLKPVVLERTDRPPIQYPPEEER